MKKKSHRLVIDVAFNAPVTERQATQIMRMELTDDVETGYKRTSLAPDIQPTHRVITNVKAYGRVTAATTPDQKSFSPKAMQNSDKEPRATVSDYDYKLMDTATRVQAQLHTVETRLLQAAVKGNVSPEVRLQMQAHLEDCIRALARLPEEE